MVEDLIQNTLRFFKDLPGFQKLKIETKVQNELTESVKVDDTRFVIILYNLISNAIKNTNDGNIKVSAKLANHDEMTWKIEKAE